MKKPTLPSGGGRFTCDAKGKLKRIANATKPAVKPAPAVAKPSKEKEA